MEVPLEEKQTIGLCDYYDAKLNWINQSKSLEKNFFFAITTGYHGCVHDVLNGWARKHVKK
ncbi:hypothetical protein DERF_007968 [Dermatophagoides farinae]|uniref:Uncharacterized protein n=1 Tax=Dermatophagoides farinae TaxID=6954 RepID=A0A922L6I2_DERFA|nr:hypothetical protein DERF_007968 [Dermatophagoides farinae]